MQVETMLSDQVARYLDLASAQAKLTAANMANVDTPGYKALGLDFEGEMRAARRHHQGRVRPRGTSCGDSSRRTTGRVAHAGAARPRQPRT